MSKSKLSMDKLLNNCNKPAKQWKNTVMISEINTQQNQNNLRKSSKAVPRKLKQLNKNSKMTSNLSKILYKMNNLSKLSKIMLKVHLKMLIRYWKIISNFWMAKQPF